MPYALYSANAKVSGFTHYLGEAFNGGIIFEIYKGSDGIEHGLIVAPTETTDIYQTTNVLVNADRSEDGAYNTNLMINSPAKTYVESLGTGWYLPSIDELVKLFNNRYYVQKGLRTNGNTILSLYKYYWSSSELFANEAFTLVNSSVDLRLKNEICIVRGVKAF